MKHSNQEDSSRNQTAEKGEPSKTNGTRTNDRNENISQQNRQGQKEQQAKQGNHDTQRPNEKQAGNK